MSPIITACSGSAPSCATISCSIRGSGFEAVSSAQRVAWKLSLSPSSPSTRSRPRRLLPVATAIQCPRARSASSSSSAPGNNCEGLGIGGDETRGVGDAELLDLSRVQLRVELRYRLRQPQADHVPEGRVPQIGQPLLFGRLAQAGHDAPHRVHQRAVPVEHEQAPHRGKVSSTFVSAASSGALTTSGWPSGRLSSIEPA